MDTRGAVFICRFLILIVFFVYTLFSKHQNHIYSHQKALKKSPLTQVEKAVLANFTMPCLTKYIENRRLKVLQ